MNSSQDTRSNIIFAPHRKKKSDIRFSDPDPLLDEIGVLLSK